MLTTLGVDRPINRAATAQAVPIMDHSRRAAGPGSRTMRELSIGFEYRNMSSLGSARKQKRSSTGANPVFAAPITAADVARGLRKKIASVAILGYLSIPSAMHLKNAQFGAARCRIQSRFLIRGRQRTLGQHGGAALQRQSAEPLLYFAVFERSEGDGHHAAAAQQQLRSYLQQSIEFALLVIHKHA